MTYQPYDDQKTQVAASGAPFAPAAPYAPSQATELVRPAQAKTQFVTPPQSEATVIRAVEQRDPAFAWLVVTKGRRLGDIMRLNKGDTALGREAENDIIVDDDFASRRHAKVRLEPDGPDDGKPVFVLYDLATPNGTLVNGEQVYKARLADGDRVQIGETVMVFKQV